MGGYKKLLFNEPGAQSLEELAERLGGEVEGVFIRCPSPRRPPDDRSCWVRFNPARPRDIFVYDCEGSKGAAYAMVRAALGLLDPFRRVDHAEAVQRIWEESRSAAGTPAERYLRRRGITLPMPPSLRFHSGLKHPSGCAYPCMVAAVSAPDGMICAVHRTFLTWDGTGKAPVDPVKMTLGPIGKNAIRLSPVAPKLIIAEGIETALSVMQASGIGAWAAISAVGLRTIELPSEVRHITVAADGDEVGAAAAFQAATRFRKEGREAEIAQAPKGKDFNDLLMASTR
jgi:Toprim domain